MANLLGFTLLAWLVIGIAATSDDELTFDLDPTEQAAIEELIENDDFYGNHEEIGEVEEESHKNPYNEGDLQIQGITDNNPVNWDGAMEEEM